MTSQKKREDLSFRWQPCEGNPSFVLIQYIRQNCKSPKQAIIEALETVWLPIACHKSQQFSSEKVKEIGTQSIKTLYGQIQLICQELDLPNPYDIETQIAQALSKFQGQILRDESPKDEEIPDYSQEHEDIF